MGRRRLIRRRRGRRGNPDLKDPFGRCVRVIDPFDGTVREICPKGGPRITSDLKDPFKSVPLGARRISVGRHDRHGIGAHMQRMRVGASAYDCNDMCYRYCDWRFDAYTDRNRNRGCHKSCNNLCSSIATGGKPAKKRRVRPLRVGRCYGARYGGRY